MTTTPKDPFSDDAALSREEWPRRRVMSEINRKAILPNNLITSSDAFPADHHFANQFRPFETEPITDYQKKVQHGPALGTVKASKGPPSLISLG
ncbi:hypothetical protein TNCT_67621 [Trichonephila clavata]|uniref:Uncharacterized protein n=1 Tax=Trichonephila clavata TaxID=2740835 RepID=A0A8X6GY67_TRICU|nr:hypothetical protein TNCT_67621 [Trichonephila clavata]